MTVLGKETPLHFTEPLRELTPNTSLGFECIEYAELVLGWTLLPWQKWLLIHALELREDGTFRFQAVVVLVARQNGKTHLIKLLALWRAYMGRKDPTTGNPPLILATSQKLDQARETWQAAVDLAGSIPALAKEIPGRRGIRHVNGEQELRLMNGARYKIAAANGNAGRGYTVDLLIMDELREHRDDEAWAALEATTTVPANAQTFAFSNAGSNKSVLLNRLRTKALSNVDPSFGIFEWSAPEGCALDDREGWAQANPGLGYTIKESKLLGYLTTKTQADFKTEHLCQHVPSEADRAIYFPAWSASRDPGLSVAEALKPYAGQVVACLDISPDVPPHRPHITLAGAAIQDDGRIRVQALRQWDDVTAVRFSLKAELERLSPMAVAWYSGGPAQSLAVLLRDLGAVEIKGATVSEACQEFASLVAAGQIVHAGDLFLDEQIEAASKLQFGDTWRFQRKGVGYVDAVYAMAGAVHTARTLPPPAPRRVSAIV